MPACRHSSIAPCSLYALSIVQHAQQRSSFLIVRLLYTMLIELHHHRRPRRGPGRVGVGGLRLQALVRLLRCAKTPGEEKNEVQGGTSSWVVAT